MKLFHACLALFFTLLLPFLMACTSKSHQQSSATNEFAVIFGSGGGFTGMAAGYIIHSNGEVEKWSGQYFRRDQIKPMGVVASEALKPLNEIFSSGILAQWSHQETGNMTTQMWCISGQDTTRVSWKGTEPGDEVPQPIRDFYAELLRIVGTLPQP